MVTRIIWNRGRFFLVPWSILLSAGTAAVFYIGKIDLHVALNARQPHSADAFFRFLTHLGEGWALAAAVLYLLFRSRHAAFFLLSAWLSSVLFIQLLKQVFFDYMRRPAAVFQGSDVIHFVEGVTYRFGNSFPSGHTGDIFSICFALTLLARDARRGWVFLIPAVSVAYSRVFLSQHFMQDILAGSFVAVCCTSLCFGIWYRKSEKFRTYLGEPIAG